MKRVLTFILLLSLCLVPAFAQASSPSLLLTGTVDTLQPIAVKAPATGELAPFGVRAGDTVSAGDVLFSVEPVNVYAPIDGTVCAVYIAPGDIAAGVSARYGALMYIDYEERYQLQVNTRTGVDKAENRDVRIGQQVWLRSNNEENFADGIVTSADPSTGNFTVQIIGGDLVFNHTIKVYRTPDYDYNATIARGTISTVAPYAVTAAGTVMDVAVTAGQQVKAGDLLFSYVPDELAPERRGKTDAAAVKAEDEWIVTSVAVQQGASVQKGQLLLTAVPFGQYEITAQAAEDEASSIHIGDVFTLCFEELDVPPTQATVLSVSPLGTLSGDETTYTVRLAFDAPEGVWPGMHATLER